MAAKKGKKAQKPSRTSADKLLMDFIQANGITLIVDEIGVLHTDVKDALYVTIKRPRVRAFYLDEINKEGRKKAKNGEADRTIRDAAMKKPGIDIVN